MTRRRKEPSAYEVGYGKPPRHTRWKPRQSGNPKGRPKGAIGKHRRLLEAMDEPSRKMFISEMYRPLTVRSDGEEITMPTIQVITRAMVKTAAAGGQQAQRTVLMLQLELEREAAKQNAAILAVARAIKDEFERRRAAGLPQPDLVVHPDDIHIDEQRQRVEIRGPWTSEQKVTLERILADRDRDAKAIAAWRATAAKNPKDTTIPILAKVAQERFDAINNLLPERYRTQLHGRMTEEEIEVAVRLANEHVARRGPSTHARKRGLS